MVVYLLFRKASLLLIIQSKNSAQPEVLPVHFIKLVLFVDELLLRAKFPSSEAGPSGTTKSAFSWRFTVYTAAVCCGCYRGHEGATSGIARWFRVEWWRLRVARWRGSLAGVAGGGRWRGSLAAGGLAGEAHKKTDQFH